MWLDPENRNPYWSYIEFVESFPDTAQLIDAHSRGWLNAVEFTVLSELGNHLLSHTSPTGDDYDNASILAGSKWQSVVADAKWAQGKLLAMGINKSELQILSARE